MNPAFDVEFQPRAYDGHVEFVLRDERGDKLAEGWVCVHRMEELRRVVRSIPSQEQRQTQRVCGEEARP